MAKTFRSTVRWALVALSAMAFTVAPLSVSSVLADGVSPQARPMALDTDPGALPEKLREIGFDQKMGDAIPLDAQFVDASGKTVRLGDFYGDKPVALSLVYFDCPMLCPLTLDGLTRSLKVLPFAVSEEYEMVVVSFDPSEGSDVALEAKEQAIRRYGRTGTDDGWHFLTGEQAEIDRLVESIGFRYTFDEERGEFAHAAGLVLTTPKGRIARYFFGVDYPPKDLRLGFVEAGEGKIGSPIDQILLYCFHYDASIGRYTAATMNIVRLGGLLTVIALVTFIIVMVRREKRMAPTDLRTA